ncbi:MAG: acyl-CoA synthetase [Flavobacteriales bacterium]|nr:acyl-CoA synthetase [Flavobacteriales bacterium]
MNLVFQQPQNFGSKTAILDANGSYSYSDLEVKSDGVASYLLSKGIKKGDRIAFLVSPEFNFPATLFGIWKAGAIAVPLCTLHPVSELQYVVDDAQVSLVVVDTVFEAISKELQSEIVRLDEIENTAVSGTVVTELDAALILYTSGTTSRPKGVVHTHKSLNATISSLVESWQWTNEDHILHVLPLHHTHGLVNKLLCCLAVGATCEFLPKFDAETVWNKFSEGNVTLFMAVPTIYSKLIKYWDDQHKERQMQLSTGCKNLRLMVSGSAALPVPVLDKWEKISGHLLLERYGMTEIGMAISNPYEGERKVGFIGKPLPGIEVQLVDEKGRVIEQENEQGEIQIKGTTVFKEYWNKPGITEESFTADGWFKTGDSAIVAERYFKILGRNSVDIIKSGGYKISALEIESKLLDHPEIEECAVVGVPNDEWGEVVAVAVVTGYKLQVSSLKDWAEDKMAPYKIPRLLKIVDELPRNVLGKVVKNEVKKLFSDCLCPRSS